MKDPERIGNIPEPRRDQFRTPRRQDPRQPPATGSVKRNRSPEPSTSGSSRKRTSLPRAQSTLTQIDFVTQSTAPDNEHFNYIDETTRTTQASNVNDGGSDKDSDYLPAPPLRSARITKFNMNERERESRDPSSKRKSSGFGDRNADRGHRPRKSETPRASTRPKGGRKSLEKSTGKRDKTLTQMDFVRRYITIDDDEDVDMGYIQPSPRKAIIKDEQETPRPGLNKTKLGRNSTPADKKHRAFQEELDLSTGDPISQPNAAQESSPDNANKANRVHAAPVTPQKSRTREIPSSQTPESPGLTIITSSQFRGATCSPSKKKPSNPPSNQIPPIKEESPRPPVVEDAEDSGNQSLPWPAAVDSRSMHDSLNMPPPNNIDNFPSSAPASGSNSQETPRAAKGALENNRTKRERTVVYETDADSDFDDTEESLDRGSPSPSPKKTSQMVVRQQASSQATQSSPKSPKDDSQELPLPAVPSSPSLDDTPQSELPMSDASVCYQRMHAATQFPHEPIPSLNTQKMAELFPQESSTQITKTRPPNPSQDQVSGPSSQTQTESQRDQYPTEMVPESSPIRGSESQPTFQRPLGPKSVVQVESSQAVDRNHSWQGHALSRSQILSSSVMESVPMPNFWMGSQDSVGEPYSLPEG